MSRKGETLPRERSTERGVSPQVGIVLLFGLVIIGATLVFSVGIVALDAIQMQATGEHEKQVLQQFDKDLTDSVDNDDVTGSVYLGDGQYNISNGSKMNITTSNGFEELSHESVDMGTLVQGGESGAEFGYQAGGIWRSEGERTTVVSKPDLRYYKGEGDLRRIDLSVMSLSGNAGSGENTVQQGSGSSLDVFGKGEFVSHVEITVEGSQYHDGWYRFMREEFNATDVDGPPNCDFKADVSFDQNLICHEDETVTVIATIDGNNPFAHHVGIEPTIYGGLSADSINGGTVGSELTVSGYANDTANASDDLFTVEEGLVLENGADIEGYPVLNGEVSVQDSIPQAAVDPIAYVSDPNFETNTNDADDRYTTNGTRVAHLTDDVIAANMSRPFETHESIDDEVNDGALGYLEDNVDDETVIEFDSGRDTIDEAGRYYTNDFDVNKIDTSDGDVHIGVGEFEDGTLSGLTVTGENQVYIYTDTDENLKIADDGSDKSVAVSGNRTGTFWLYGTSETEITFEDNAAFDGVIYAPDSELNIHENADITGSVVGGETTVDDDVTINFDRSLRTDIPIPEENQDITVKEARDPLDVTFVLDGSGSMGGVGTVTGDEWQTSPGTPLMVDSDASHSLEARTCYFFSCSSSETVEPGETTDSNSIRIKGGSSETTVDVQYGNDPFEIRADATREFIDALNESNDDRAGVFEFDRYGKTVHELSGDLSSVRNDVSVSANGSTDISKGMTPALDQYSDLNDNERVMVLLSDGENSFGDDETEEAVDDTVDKGVTVYTIGLGNDVDEELLNETIAVQTGGEYYNAEDTEELEEQFELIAKRVTADEEITFEVGDIPDPGESSSNYVVNIETQQVRIEN